MKHKSLSTVNTTNAKNFSFVATVEVTKKKIHNKSNNEYNTTLRACLQIRNKKKCKTKGFRDE